MPLDSLSDKHKEQAARLTMHAVAERCALQFGSRFVAAYAMGSLARGGFSPLVSDVDVGVMLTDPIATSDARTIDSIKSSLQDEEWGLAERLSIFWGSRQYFFSPSSLGRFPPFDRLDFIDHATLLLGQECRSGLPRPDRELLEVDGFQFALDYLATAQRIEEFHEPSRLINQGPVYLSKTILFPVRFIFTSLTGKVAGNDNATAYYLEHYTGADADLVRFTYQWREQNNLPDDASELHRLVSEGLMPLYKVFLQRYLIRFKELDRQDLLAAGFRWADELGLQLR